LGTVKSDYPDYYIYPAIFSYAIDGISISFPDLPGCLPCADNDTEAFINATEALELHLWSMERDGDPILLPTPIEHLHISAHEVTVLIRANMKLTRMQLNSKAENKTVTIPRWLNDLAEESGVNFSQVMQTALKDVLGVSEDPPYRRSA